MKCKKGKKTIEVSPKAFRVIYQPQGYKAEGGTEKPSEEDKKESTKKLTEMDLSELKELAEAKGIEGSSSLNREELLKVLKDVE